MIRQIPYPNNHPEVPEDYQKQNELLKALLKTRGSVIKVEGNRILPGAIFQIGGCVYWDEDGTEVSGTVAPHVRLLIDKERGTMDAEFVDTQELEKADVKWNPAYNHYDDNGYEHTRKETTTDSTGVEHTEIIPETREGYYIVDEAQAIKDGYLTEPRLLNPAYVTVKGDQRIEGEKRFQDTSTLQWEQPLSEQLPQPEKIIPGLEPATLSTPPILRGLGNGLFALLTDNVLKTYRVVVSLRSTGAGYEFTNIEDETKTFSTALVKPNLGVLSSGLVVVFDAGTGNLRLFRRRDGFPWVPVDGSDLFISRDIASSAIAVLSPQRFAFADQKTNSIRIVKVVDDSRMEVEEGSTKVFNPPLEKIDMVAMKHNRVTLVNTNTLMCLEFDGEWVQIGRSFKKINREDDNSISKKQPVLLGLNGTDVVLSQLTHFRRIYRLTDEKEWVKLVDIYHHPANKAYKMASLDSNHFFMVGMPDGGVQHTVLETLKLTYDIGPTPYSVAGGAF